jgi:hypothetical protein
MTKKIPEVLFPLFWIDEVRQIHAFEIVLYVNKNNRHFFSVKHFEIDKKSADMFYYQVKLPLDVINIGKYFIFSVGASLILLCTFFAIRLYRNNKANMSIAGGGEVVVEDQSSSSNERASLLNKSRSKANAYNSTDEILNVPNEIVD